MLDATGVMGAPNKIQGTGRSPWVGGEVGGPGGDRQPVSVVGGCVSTGVSTCRNPVPLTHPQNLKMGQTLQAPAPGSSLGRAPQRVRSAGAGGHVSGTRES